MEPTVDPSLEPAANRALPRDALTDRVYDELLSRIIDLRFPPGGRLKIDQLAQELGVSHTPIREALNRLASERLVEARPYRGFAVTPLLDETGLRHLLDARLVLETGAITRAAVTISAGALDELDRLVAAMDATAAGDRLDVRAFNELDARFHQTAVSAAGNPFLRAAFDDLRTHVQIARHFTGRSARDSRDANSEHRRLVAALRAGDAVAAAAEVRAHIESTYARLSEQPSPTPLTGDRA